MYGINIQLISGHVIENATVTGDDGEGIVKISFGHQKGLEVVDSNVVRHTGASRIKSKKKTPFQELLAGIKDSVSDKTALQVLKVPTLRSTNPGDVGMFSREDQDIFDAWNDNSRRFFEIILAEKFLKHLIKTQGPMLEALIDDMTACLQSEYDKEGFPNIAEWRKITTEGVITGINDLNLKGFASFRASLVELLKEKESKEASLLLKLYDFHYLTHQASGLKSYQDHHPAGTLKSYTLNSKYYRGGNRGRIVGFAFNTDANSSHLGIMRQLDPTPTDLRLPKLSLITRCPDRLYLVKPSAGHRDRPDSFIHQSFQSPENSMYVNGLSGSALLEINTTLLHAICIQQGLFKSSRLKTDALIENHGEILKNYWLMIISMFVYFEGGHSFTETMSVFELENINTNIKTILGLPPGTFSAETIMFDRPEYLGLIKDALIETAQYQRIMDNKSAIHTQLEGMFEPATFEKISKGLDVVLNEFEILASDRDNFNSDQAFEEAKALCRELKVKKDTEFLTPTKQSISRFAQCAEFRVDNAMNTFRNDLTTLQKFANVLISIGNVIICCLTLSYKSDFFQKNTPTVETSTKNLRLKLKDELLYKSEMLHRSSIFYKSPKIDKTKVEVPDNAASCIRSN